MPKARAKPSQRTGILPIQDIRALVVSGAISADRAFEATQIQPASLDLRLDGVAYRVRASFLPGGPGARVGVMDRLKELALHTIDLSSGAVLETGCVYIVPLMESLDLPAELSASTNPKSSTGRLDIFTRVITDRAQEFDKVPAGYSGPLYLEISPRTFPIVVRRGSRLSQIRFRKGNALLSDAELLALHASDTLVASDRPNVSGGGILLQGRIPDEGWVPDLLCERVIIGLEILFPDKQEPVRALGRVAWLETKDPKTMECQIGIKFREITRRDQDRLFQFVIENQFV